MGGYLGGRLGWTHPSHQNKFQMERRFKSKKKKKKFKTFDSQTFSAFDVRFCLNDIQDTGRLQIFHISRTSCVIKLPPSGHPTRGKCGPPPRPSAGISLYGSQRTELPQGFAKSNIFHTEDPYTPIFIMTVVENFTILI